jgi:CheY-like chemotaxis protein
MGKSRNHALGRRFAQSDVMLFSLSFPPMAIVVPVILHVENDSDDAFLTQRAFKKAGVNNPITVVENGEQGVAYLHAEGRFSNRQDYPAPAVILLDWNMPLMSGADFLRWLRAQPDLKRIPVVVLTSSNNDADMHQAYELGSNGYLVKPHTQEEFQAMAQAFAGYWLTWNRSDSHLP